MKIGYKFILLIALVITAVALCALPFLTINKDAICVYTKQNVPNKQEEIFIRELAQLGYNVPVNSQKCAATQKIAFWFRAPEFASEIANSSAQYNFLYSDKYYPFDWYDMQKYPVVLTPYQDLYEHYVRSNIKSALFEFASPEKAAARLHQLIIWLRENQ